MKKVQRKVKSKAAVAKSSNKQVADLQRAVLNSALTGEPLPGSDAPVRFADLSFILRADNVLLSKDNLAGPIAVPNAPKPIRTVTTAALTQQARTEGDLAILEFQSPKVSKDEIALTLSGKLIPGEPGRGELGLSSLTVKFRKVDGKWQVVEGPVASAA